LANFTSTRVCAASACEFVVVALATVAAAYDAARAATRAELMSVRLLGTEILLLGGHPLIGRKGYGL